MGEEVGIFDLLETPRVCKDDFQVWQGILFTPLLLREAHSQHNYRV